MSYCNDRHIECSEFDTLDSPNLDIMTTVARRAEADLEMILDFLVSWDLAQKFSAKMR